MVFASHKNLKPPEAGGQRVAARTAAARGERVSARAYVDVVRRIFVFPNLYN